MVAVTVQDLAADYPRRHRMQACTGVQVNLRSPYLARFYHTLGHYPGPTIRDSPTHRGISARIFFRRFGAWLVVLALGSPRNLIVSPLSEAASQSLLVGFRPGPPRVLLTTHSSRRPESSTAEAVLVGLGLGLPESY